MFNYKEKMALMACCFLAVSQVYALTDPTRPPSYKEETDKSISAKEKFETVLNAIFISAQHKLAVINGKVIKDGEKFEKSTVKIIDQHRVKLTDMTGEKILDLFLVNIKDKK